MPRAKAGDDLMVQHEWRDLDELWVYCAGCWDVWWPKQMGPQPTDGCNRMWYTHSKDAHPDLKRIERQSVMLMYQFNKINQALQKLLRMEEE